MARSIRDAVRFLVAARDGRVVGWGRITAYSARPCLLRGRGRGVGLRHGRLDGEWRDVLLVGRLLGRAVEDS